MVRAVEKTHSWNGLEAQEAARNGKKVKIAYFAIVAKKSPKRVGFGLFVATMATEFFSLFLAEQRRVAFLAHFSHDWDMAIELSGELTEWVKSEEAQAEISRIVRDAIREELRAALSEELLDTDEAARLLNMSPGALRKAVERGHVRCERVGRRLRFRRSELLRCQADGGGR